MAETPRFVTRFATLERQSAALGRATARATYSELERAGLLQTFALSFELSWKVMEDWLTHEGVSVASPREALRQAFASGLLDDAALWLEMLESRNVLTHSYDETSAEEAEELVKARYAPVIFAFVDAMRARIPS